MNDTFLSIENATGVAGWEIRAGLCRFPPTGRGARLTTNLWSIKKMTDASGNVCSLSPEVSVYSCLWMICPWWLFEAGSEFIWLQMKSLHSHTASRAKTPASQSDSHHPSTPDKWTWMRGNTGIYYCSLLSVCQSEPPFHDCLWLLTHLYCIDEVHLCLQFKCTVGSINCEITFWGFLYKSFNVEEPKSKWTFRWRKHLFQGILKVLLNTVHLKCVSSQCTGRFSFASTLTSY